MILPEKKLEEQLIQLIKENQSFAIYKLPLDEEIRFVAQLDSSPNKYHNLSDLNNKKGFVISPFKVEDNFPIILIEPDIATNGLENIILSLEKRGVSNQKEFHKNLKTTDKKSIEEEYKLYQKIFNKFVTPLKEGKLKKLVLSRSHSIERPKNYSFISSFLTATKTYPKMMSYVCYTPQTGMWIGNSPEIILSGENREWHTVALAGTISLNSDNQGNSSWDEKNIEEQEVVSQYIRNIIAPHTTKLEEEGPYTAQAGNVAHLKTDFSFTLNDNNMIGNLLDELHPTPAVCGFPKQDAFHFILENESSPRKYYSGIIGMLNPEGKTNLYVNLRCAEITSSNIILYAGGGIMPTSSVESEWQETNHKMQTLLNVL